MQITLLVIMLVCLATDAVCIALIVHHHRRATEYLRENWR
jgi:hypothetical protein